MIDEIQKLRTQVEADIASATSSDTAEAFRLKHLVRKGTIAQLFDRLREVPNDKKREVGQALNELRAFAESSHANAIANGAATSKTDGSSVDITLPARRIHHGHTHPISQAMGEMESIFTRMGFAVSTGPEIEDDAHNFGLLNFADDHPARDMQDTFFIESGDRTDVLLRTHTSSEQIRYMQTHKPPIRAIMPGRVYRNEAISARSGAEFHMCEGLVVDEGVNMAQLKGTVIEFAKAYYGADVKYRFRPSYFPFTEPSAEVDIDCFLCKGKGCRVCKYTGWLEIMGCGMVHPNVLRNCNIDPEVYTGYAFGCGVERTLMLKIGLDDLRVLYENDIRFLEQF